MWKPCGDVCMHSVHARPCVRMLIHNLVTVQKSDASCKPCALVKYFTEMLFWIALLGGT